MNIRELNAAAWNNEVEKGSYWARIVSEDIIENARNGHPQLHVTVNRNIPEKWIANLRGKHVLVLGGGGGQQTPVLSAFGCDTECADISSSMLERDREALEKYKLKARLHNLDMRDLSEFETASFDAVISPVSLNFVDDINAVYKGVARILRPGGSYIFGIANPALYLFDDRLLEKGKMKVKYTLPFSDERSLSEKELKKRIDRNDTIEYSHTLDSILGLLTDAGFSIRGFFSDESTFEPIDSFLHDCYLAFWAVRVDD